MHLLRSIGALFFVSCALLGSSCGGGGSSAAAVPVDPPATPTSLIAFVDDAAVTLSWSAAEGASGYDLFWGTSSGVSTSTGTLIADVASPFTHTGLSNGVSYYYVVVAHNAVGASGASNQASCTPVAFSGAIYDPVWRAAVPSQTIAFTYDAQLSTDQNGTSLANVIAGLLPGQELLVGGGLYTFTTDFTINAQGTQNFPIWIKSDVGAAVTFARAAATLPVVSFGETGGGITAQFVCLRGVEITGGTFGVQLRKSTNVWVDRCHIHDVGGAGISAADVNTSHLYFTRNEIHDTSSWGEGIALGNNGNGSSTHDTVVALNHIHDTRGAIEGDGIDLRFGSYANWIAQNVIHHTKYPAIIFQSTNGNPVNLIERNVCYDTLDNVVQAEGGEAIVRNNVLVGPCSNKIFDSTHNQATLRDLTVIHNTMFAQAGYAAGLFAWNGQTNLVFANNAVYSNPVGTTGYAIAYSSGYAGGTLAGNVVVGYTPSVSNGFVTGVGLSDFSSVSSWSQGFVDLESLRPSLGSALDGAAQAIHALGTDIEGAVRSAPADAGALEGH